MRISFKFDDNARFDSGITVPEFGYPLQHFLKYIKLDEKYSDLADKIKSDDLEYFKKKFKKNVVQKAARTIIDTMTQQRAPRDPTYVEVISQIVSVAREGLVQMALDYTAFQHKKVFPAEDSHLVKQRILRFCSKDLEDPIVPTSEGSEYVRHSWRYNDALGPDLLANPEDEAFELAVNGAKSFADIFNFVFRTAVQNIYRRIDFYQMPALHNAVISVSGHEAPSVMPLSVLLDIVERKEYPSAQEWIDIIRIYPSAWRLILQMGMSKLNSTILQDPDDAVLANAAAYRFINDLIKGEDFEPVQTNTQKNSTSRNASVSTRRES